MEIKKIESRSVAFGTLKIGDVFTDNEHIFFRINGGLNETVNIKNAVCLDDGILATFNDCNEVIPCEAILTIKEK